VSADVLQDTAARFCHFEIPRGADRPRERTAFEAIDRVQAPNGSVSKQLTDCLHGWHLTPNQIDRQVTPRRIRRCDHAISIFDAGRDRLLTKNMQSFAEGADSLLRMISRR
jgi:hypothetical protein